MSVRKTLLLSSLVTISQVSGITTSEYLEINKDYTQDYFRYLELKRTVPIQLDKIRKEMSNAKSINDSTKRAYLKELDHYNRLNNELAGIPMRIIDLNRVKDEAQLAIPAAKKKAVDDLLFSASETVDQATTDKKKDALSAEISSLTKQQEKVDNEIADIKSQPQWQNLVAEKNQTYSELVNKTAQRSRLEVQISGLKDDLFNLTQDIAQINFELSQLDERGSLINEELPALEQTKIDLSEDIAQVNADIDTNESVKAQLVIEIDNIQRRLANIQDNETILIEQLAKQQRRLRDIRQKIKAAPQLEKDLSKINTDLPLLNTSKRKIERELTKKGDDKTRIKGSISDINADIASIKNDIKTNNATINGLNKQLKPLNNQIKKIKNAGKTITKLQGEKAKVETSIANTETSILTLETEIANLEAIGAENLTKKQKRQLRQKIKRLEGKNNKKSLRRILVQLIKKNDNLSTQITNLQDSVSGLQGLIDQKEDINSQIQSTNALNTANNKTIQTKKQERRSIQKTLDSKNNEIKQLNNDLSKTTTAIRNKQNKRKSIKKTLENMPRLKKERRNLNTNLIPQTEQDLEEARKKIQRRQGRINQLQIQVEDIEESLSLQSDDVFSMQERYSDLRNQINFYNSEMRDISNQTRKLVAEINTNYAIQNNKRITLSDSEQTLSTVTSLIPSLERNYERASRNHNYYYEKYIRPHVTQSESLGTQVDDRMDKIRSYDYLMKTIEVNEKAIADSIRDIASLKTRSIELTPLVAAQLKLKDETQANYESAKSNYDQKLIKESRLTEDLRIAKRDLNESQKNDENYSKRIR